MARAGWLLIHRVFIALLVVCAFVVAPVSTGAVAFTDERGSGAETANISGTTVSTDTTESLPEIDIDADVTIMEARIAEDGSASWQVTYKMELAGDADVEAFEQLQTEIENDPSSYLGPFRERMNRTVAAAESVTSREMEATAFEVTTERDSQPQSEFGLVTFQFEWAGFAATTDSRIRAGDAVDSLFLDEGESLEFEWPDGYSVASQTPNPQTTSADQVVWRGPIDFDSGEPRLVLSADGDGGDSPGSDGPGDGTDNTDSTGLGFATVPLLGIVGLALVGATVLFLRRREEEEAQPTEGAASSTAQQQTPPDELLSNQERVLRLLQQNGGRMKQKQVAEQLEWTAAKTSQVVGDLRDEDEIEAFRLGRENVLTLPDVDLEGSSTDEQQDNEDESA